MTRRRPAWAPLLVVGSGRAAGALAAAAGAAAGPDAVAVWARDDRAARRIARATGVGVADPGETAWRAVLIAVTDAAVGEVASRLARGLAPRGGRARPEVVWHAAGAWPAALLAPLARRGCATGVFHPAVPLDGPTSAGRLDDAIVTLSGVARAVRLGAMLARGLGARPVRVRDAERARLHLAASLAANDVVALLAEAERHAARAGLDPATARRLVTLLARGAVEGFERRGGDALTGPVSRGDLQTLSRHLAVVDRSPRREADLSRAHRALGRIAARLARAAGRLDARTYRDVVARLGPDADGQRARHRRGTLTPSRRSRRREP